MNSKFRSSVLSFPTLVLAGVFVGSVAGYSLGIQIIDSGRVRATGSRSTSFRNFETYHFSGSSLCSPCHDRLNSTDETVISLVSDWTQSLMAYSFVDPLWRAKVRSETLRNEHLTGLIEEKCVRCHAPMASVEAQYSNSSIDLFGSEGLTQESNPLYSAAMEGVSCTFCHQILDDPALGTDEGNSGKFKITEAYPSLWERPIFGQFDQVQTSQMVGSVRYLPQYSAHLHESRVCATCHDLKTPYVDANGDLVTDKEGNLVLFPEQMPFREWSNSIYGADEGSSDYTRCHECHLSHAEPTPLSRIPGQLEAREDFSKHTFFTENIILLEILDAFDRALGIGDVDFSEVKAEGEVYLSGAGMVEVKSVTVDEDNQLWAVVRVENFTGHKLPTSIPIRRAFIHFTVVDQRNDSVLFESGRPLADGRIQGVDADGDPSLFEPHYDEITSGDEVQIYEGIMENTEEEVTYTLLRAARFAKDNRLLPYGFDKGSVEDDVKPAGACLEDPNFIGGEDEVTYIADIHDVPISHLMIRVELLDQTLSYRFIQDLFQDSGDSIVSRFHSMYEPFVSRFETIESVEVALEMVN
ncbi:MAG: hypothetical protein JSU96_10390 [Acidobacteriota bacterium]|nr:MAG: hypothetical protein JSU96_10390 [Acidobacteriota bacterium]